MIVNADARSIPLTDASVHCVVTSPPYWGLRDYGIAGQLGLERTPEEYVAALVAVFREVWRVLRDDGTLWLNLGDSYASGEVGRHDGYNPPTLWGHENARTLKPFGPRQQRRVQTGLKPKDLIGVPWRVAFALQADGWYLRSDIVWSKPNPMPESVTDRPTKSHEYLFLLSKKSCYYYDSDAIREPRLWPDGPNGPDSIKSPYGQGFTRRAGVSRDDYEARKWDDRSDGLSRPPMTMRDRQYNPAGRNRRSVWEIATQPYPEAHFATFPEALVEPCVLAGSPAGGMVLDPFAGSGTVGLVCQRLGRRFVGIELKPEYCAMAYKRTAQMGLV